MGDTYSSCHGLDDVVFRGYRCQGVQLCFSLIRVPCRNTVALTTARSYAQACSYRTVPTHGGVCYAPFRGSAKGTVPGQQRTHLLGAGRAWSKACYPRTPHPRPNAMHIFGPSASGDDNIAYTSTKSKISEDTMLVAVRQVRA